MRWAEDFPKRFWKHMSVAMQGRSNVTELWIIKAIADHFKASVQSDRWRFEQIAACPSNQTEQIERVRAILNSGTLIRENSFDVSTDNILWFVVAPEVTMTANILIAEILDPYEPMDCGALVSTFSYSGTWDELHDKSTLIISDFREG